MISQKISNTYKLLYLLNTRNDVTLMKNTGTNCYSFFNIEKQFECLKQCKIQKTPSNDLAFNILSREAYLGL